MSVADSIPGMAAGSTGRNVIVGIVYLFALPFLIALLPLTLGAIVGFNVGGIADKLSGLPGVSDGGGIVSGVAAAGFAMLLFVGLGIAMPADDTNDTQQSIEDSGATATDAGSQAAATATATQTAAPTATPTATAEPTPEPTPTATATPAQDLSHSVGESFTVGSGAQTIEYTVTDVSTTDRVGSDVVGEDADGQFVIIKLEMTNTGDESLDLSSRPFTLVDSQDREFEVDTMAMGYTENSIVFEQLNPGLSKTGVIVFDVNPDGEYDLHIAPAGMFSTAETHTVDLEGEIQ